MDLYSLENPNPSLDLYIDVDDYSLSQFDCFFLNELSNYEAGYGFIGGAEKDQSSYTSSPAVTSPPEKVSRSEQDPLLLVQMLVSGGASSSTNAAVNVMRNEGKRKMQGDGPKPQRVAFKTKSKLDVLDDGYRWRKYGKKPLKNNPNLRNYYKCTSGGCQVKKIVERWIEDSSYVITQYDGVHTHESSCSYYYDNNNNHHLQGVTATDYYHCQNDDNTYIPSAAETKVHLK
uniref:WRKY domain-containing protein n=1 Tax=Kalanchoe fedtschenkoi TaxID=63787 RepID=A0A7N0UPW0_KALFE